MSSTARSSGTARSSETPDSPELVIVFGLGITGLAVVRALHSRSIEVIAADDRPTAAARKALDELAIPLHEAPSPAELEEMMGAATAVHPTPGLPEHHAVFELAAAHDVAIVSEFDLAQRWDSRPVVAITGTDGKTSVCTMATQMLIASGVNATMCGNTDVPLIEAIEDASHQVFVVEASSFRLAQSQAFAPTVGTWLNYGPDHLDVHSDLSVYENSKAKVFATTRGGGVLVANADDPVVMKHLHARVDESAVSSGAEASPTVSTFGRLADASFGVRDGVLVGPQGPLVRVDELWRSYPHDIENVLAAAASVLPVGATVEGIRSTARDFVGLPHRVQMIRTVDDVRYVNDSKATVPHATLSAIESFAGSAGQIVLLAGGKNKGLDLTPLASAGEHLRAVVAIGDAATEVIEAFAGSVPVTEATSMTHAVELAQSLAQTGDVVLLSPACASFDWYRSYGERGEDFIACVESLGSHA